MEIYIHTHQNHEFGSGQIRRNPETGEISIWFHADSAALCMSIEAAQALHATLAVLIPQAQAGAEIPDLGEDR